VVSDLIAPDPDNDGQAEFDLLSKIPEIVGGQTGITVYFYETHSEAVADLNRILNPEVYINESNPQTIYTRLVSGPDACFAIGNFDIYADPALGVTETVLASF
jgi:hypothetical protein